ncbi:hypothetical protein WDW89_15440 [Deltaproteobacteria bacterium TL4]
MNLIRKKLKAFSMVEILTVLGIMSLLTAALLPLAGRNIEEANITKAGQEAKGLGSAVMSFNKDVGWWPYVDNSGIYMNNTKVIDALLSGPGSNSGARQSIQYHLIEADSRYAASLFKGPYVSSTFLDPWDKDYEVFVRGFCPTAVTDKYIWVLSGGEDGVQTKVSNSNLDSTDYGFLLFSNPSATCR